MALAEGANQFRRLRANGISRYGLGYHVSSGCDPSNTSGNCQVSDILDRLSLGRQTDRCDHAENEPQRPKINPGCLW